MKCHVCGKDYDTAECPRCSCPNIQLMGDSTAAHASILATVQAYKKEFLSKVKIELVAYRWKAQDGRLTEDREERILLGTALKLQNNGVIWLPNKFSRVPDQRTISVTVVVTESSAPAHRLQVALPNLLQTGVQQLGISLDDELNFQLLLRNDAQQSTKSAPIPLLPA